MFRIFWRRGTINFGFRLPSWMTAFAVVENLQRVASWTLRIVLRRRRLRRLIVMMDLVL
jgi:hypothetical protein